jgi:hypothetical protein
VVDSITLIWQVVQLQLQAFVKFKENSLPLASELESGGRIFATEFFLVGDII